MQEKHSLTNCWLPMLFFLSMSGPQQRPIQGQHFFTENVTERFASAVAKLGGVVTEKRVLANFIVCDDIGQPGARNELAMALMGGCLLSSSCLTQADLDGGKFGEGTCLAFKRAMGVPKWIWISHGFFSGYPGLSKIIRQACSVQPKPRLWKILSYDDFVVRSSTLSL